MLSILGLTCSPAGGPSSYQNRLNYKQDPGFVFYAYDPAGRMTQVEDYNSGNRAEYDFAYDNMNRLTSTTTNYEFTSIGALTVQYGYDAASNRVSMTDPQGTQTSYAYDNLNRGAGPHKCRLYVSCATVTSAAPR
jgi:YD repeat-containing protein